MNVWVYQVSPSKFTTDIHLSTVTCTLYVYYIIMCHIALVGYHLLVVIIAWLTLGIVGIICVNAIVWVKVFSQVL